MATERTSTQPSDRIAHPLHKLSGTIRRYIVFEGLAVVLVYLATVFWLGLAIDYGAFKLLGIDWVQYVPGWARGVVLAGLAFVLVATVAWKVLFRIFKSFSYRSLALVLERRFPKLLRDRLITAVELADLRKAKRYGYSEAMIRQTIADVTAKVDRIPVGKAFNWGRLRWMFGIGLFLSLGLLVLCGIVYVARYRTGAVDFGWKFADVTSIWAERNLLLTDTLWPRRAYLKVIDFPESGDLRIGRDAPSPRLRVRALKWVIADPKDADGWRALTWADLDPDWLGGPAPDLPTDLMVAPLDKGRATDASDPEWTIDRIEWLLTENAEARDRVRAGIDAERFLALERVLEALDRKAGEARMSRRLRKLQVPAEVTLTFWGAKTSNEMPLTRQADGYEYAGVLTDLTESIEFVVRGEDYSTYPAKRITLVPPPMLTNFSRDEYVPAYQYLHPPSDGGDAALKGLKVERLDQGISLTGGTSRFDVVAGTDVVLRGELDKDLAQIRLRYRGTKNDKGEVQPGEVETIRPDADPRRFTKRFDNLTRVQEFDLEFTDTDNVKSLRHVIIEPREDRVPEVNVAVEVVRKTNQGYMVSKKATIPFSGTVRDDGGISRVEYQVSYVKLESSSATAGRAVVAAGAYGLVTGNPFPTEYLAAAGLLKQLALMTESREAVLSPPPFRMKTFDEYARDRLLDRGYGQDRLPELLKNPPPAADSPLVKQFDIKAKYELFDLRDQIPSLQAGDALVPPRYRLRLTVAAADNNIETGPRIGVNRETFTFLVVPDEELLAEIGKEEETISGKMRNLIDAVEEIQTRIGKMADIMPREVGGDDFKPVQGHGKDIEEALGKARDLTQEIFNDYSRIHNEMKTNRLPDNVVNSAQNIVTKLDEALRGHLPRCEEANLTLKRELDARQPPPPLLVENVRLRHQELYDWLKQIEAAMRQIGDIYKLAQELTRITENQRNLGSKLKEILVDMEEDYLDALGLLVIEADKVSIERGAKATVRLKLKRTALIGKVQIKVETPVGSELVVSPVVTAPRYKDAEKAAEQDVTFEIAAGSKAGTFKLKLTPNKPQDPKPVEVVVTVK